MSAVAYETGWESEPGNFELQPEVVERLIVDYVPGDLELSTEEWHMLRAMIRTPEIGRTEAELNAEVPAGKKLKPERFDTFVRKFVHTGLSEGLLIEGFGEDAEYIFLPDCLTDPVPFVPRQKQGRVRAESDSTEARHAIRFDRSQGNCKNAGENLFMPGRGGDATSAKAGCDGCPVKNPCLEAGLADYYSNGVWGGTTEAERRVIRKERVQAAREAAAAAAKEHVA